jgi:hypothetical protein
MIDTDEIARKKSEAINALLWDLGGTTSLGGSVVQIIEQTYGLPDSVVSRTHMMGEFHWRLGFVEVRTHATGFEIVTDRQQVLLLPASSPTTEAK